MYIRAGDPGAHSAANSSIPIVTQNVFSVARHQPKRTGIRGARTSPARILRTGARQRHRASNGADEDEDETAAVSVRQRAGYYNILVCAGVLLQRRRAEKSRSISKGETQHNKKTHTNNLARRHRLQAGHLRDHPPPPTNIHTLSCEAAFVAFQVR